MSSQDEDSFEEEQPLSLLTLFRPRLVDQLNLNKQIIQKLYETLCCPICQCLLNMPVYLRCSHRFCKQCIQKYLRIQSENKSCPTCRSKVATKRELRNDYQITTIVNMAFGNSDQFRKAIQNVQKQEIEQLKSTHVKPMIKQNSKRDRPQSIQLKQKVQGKQIITKKKKAEVTQQQRTNQIKTAQLQNRLKEEYGEQFRDQIERAYGITMIITLKKLESSLFTKQIELSNIQTLTKATVQNIITFLSRKLNIVQYSHLLKIYAKQQDNIFVQMTNKTMTIKQINELYWSGLREDFSLFDMKDLLQNLKDSSKMKIPQRRVLYYKFDFSQINLQQ